MTPGKIISFFLILSLVACKQVDKADCREYKTGTFYLGRNLENGGYTIKRNVLMQMETEKRSGAISVWRIEWLTDCKYKLTLMSAKNTGNTVTFDIVKATDDYYIFKSEFNLMQKEISDTIWRTDKGMP